MAKISAEAQRLYNAFKGRFASASDAAAFLSQAKDQLYFGGHPLNFMERANDVLGGFGVERLRSSDGRAKAYFVNMGDPYDTTLMFIRSPGRDRFVVGSWGDWLEALENRGIRFDGVGSTGGFLG